VRYKKKITKQKEDLALNNTISQHCIKYCNYFQVKRNTTASGSVIFTFTEVYLLGAFAKRRKASIMFIISVFLSV
jgi:hypothetical protein